jgi:hypothetical protein
MIMNKTFKVIRAFTEESFEEKINMFMNVFHDKEYTIDIKIPNSTAYVAFIFYWDKIC